MSKFPASRLAIGTGSLLGRSSRRSSKAVLEQAINNGILHIDTARLYGKGEVERLVGEVTRHRPDVTIATKVGLGPASSGTSQRVALRMANIASTIASGHTRPPSRITPTITSESRANLDKGYLRQSVDTSLRLLKREAVDCLLLHEAWRSDITSDVIEELERFKAAGKIRDYGLATARARLGTPHIIKDFPVIQTHGGPLTRQTPVAVHGSIVIHHSIFGQRGSSLQAFQEWLLGSSPFGQQWRQSISSPSDYDGLARTILLWTMQNPSGDCLIMATSKPHRVPDWSAMRDLPADHEKNSFIYEAVQAFRSDYYKMGSDD